MIETIALWIIAIGLVIGLITLLGLIDLIKRTEQVLITQMKSLSEMYEQGIGALTLTLEGVKERVKILEDEVL
jgi:uncharacterized protein YoxC